MNVVESIKCHFHPSDDSVAVTRTPRNRGNVAPLCMPCLLAAQKSATARSSGLCGDIRYRDNVSICNLAYLHMYEHRVLGDAIPDGDSGATYRPELAKWDHYGREQCNHCGHRLDENGYCLAPRSAAD